MTNRKGDHAESRASEGDTSEMDGDGAAGDAPAEALPDDTHPDDAHPDDTHPDDADPDEARVWNRQAIFGGVVVAVTLGIAAWLAYGVVQRSGGGPRAAAGLTASGATASGATAPKSHSKHPGSVTTHTKPSTTTTTRAHHGGGTHTTTTVASPPGGGNTNVPSPALWAAYSSAWKGECQSIWAHSTNGNLYDPDDIGSVYTIDDCLRTLDRLFLTDNVATVPEATHEGREDAISFTSNLTLSGRLCWVDPATDQIEGYWSGNT